MALLHRFVPRLSVKSAFALSVAIGYLAWALTPESRAELKAVASTTQSASSDFPHAVKFEQGATRFADGDKIVITEIRGTAETFSRGNIYLIKGTYTLGSHDRATLAAYITATEAKSNF